MEGWVTPHLVRFWILSFCGQSTVVIDRRPKDERRSKSRAVEYQKDISKLIALFTPRLKFRVVKILGVFVKCLLLAVLQSCNSDRVFARVLCCACKS